MVKKINWFNNILCLKKFRKNLKEQYRGSLFRSMPLIRRVILYINICTKDKLLRSKNMKLKYYKYKYLNEILI